MYLYIPVTLEQAILRNYTRKLMYNYVGGTHPPFEVKFRIVIRNSTCG